MQIPARLLAFAVLLFGNASLVRAENPFPDGKQSPLEELVPWLLDEGKDLRGIAFRDVILLASGKKVLAVDRANDIDQRVIKKIGAALDETVRRMNQPDSPVQSVERINEVSSHFEDMLRDLLNRSEGLKCDYPLTADGKVQRSGYPDLQINDVASGRVYYLDPKLYAQGARDTTLRTFYFEPRKATNKVTSDAVHLIAGFEHAPSTAPRWKFSRWDLVDLANFKVGLKAEFQGSNRDLYRPEAIIATGSGQKPQ